MNSKVQDLSGLGDFLKSLESYDKAAQAFSDVLEKLDQPVIILKAKPDKPAAPVLKTRDFNPGFYVIYCNNQARIAGISPGETLDIGNVPENRYERACFKVQSGKKFCDAKKISLGPGVQVLFLCLKSRKEERSFYSGTTRYTFNSILGKSKRIKDSIRLARKAACNSSNILITGENGTGKELFAQAVHSASPRSKFPFVPLNCGAIPKELIESELFGHEKGAFTGAAQRREGRFELAQGGTIFLDEIGEMPLLMQVRLLRVLQEKQFYRVGGTKPVKIDVRVIAATNKKLEQMVSRGGFRMDLFYRLKVLEIRVPALRERIEDIPVLARYFLDHLAPQFQKNIKGISEKVYSAMVQYEWPGNIRELENFIEAEINLCESFELSHVPDYMIKNIDSGNPDKPGFCTHFDFPENTSADPGSSACSIAHAAKEAFIAAFNIHKGNMTKVSKSLGISRATAYRRLKEYGMNDPASPLR
jgi:transcriptional regulator with PAS, ATPase and Fis domain